MQVHGAKSLPKAARDMYTVVDAALDQSGERMKDAVVAGSDEALALMYAGAEASMFAGLSQEEAIELLKKAWGLMEKDYEKVVLYGP